MGRGVGGGAAAAGFAAVGHTYGDEAVGGGGGGSGGGGGGGGCCGAESPPHGTADAPRDAPHGMRRPRQLSPLIATPDPAAGGGGGAAGGAGDEGDIWCETALEITREAPWRSKAPPA